MPNFTTESDVRLRFQMTDAVVIPADLIEACIDDAHAEILRALDPDVDLETPEPALVTGETLLSGAYVLRALASRDAHAQKHVTIGGQRIDSGERFRALTAAAALAEKQAWYLLEPYVADRSSDMFVETTVTVPVLGEE